MEELSASHRRKFTGRSCSLHPDELTNHAILVALARAETALAEGRLLSPVEAMALARGEARERETLFSLARSVAWETGGNEADILCKLGERYPEYA